VMGFRGVCPNATAPDEAMDTNRRDERRSFITVVLQWIVDSQVAAKAGFTFFHGFPAPPQNAASSGIRLKHARKPR
jgi:hypothetical protein